MAHCKLTKARNVLLLTEETPTELRRAGTEVSVRCHACLTFLYHALPWDSR